MRSVFRFVLSFIFLLILSSQVYAQENWVITNYRSDLNIDSSGVIEVKEQIDVDFGSLSKHGIFRSIPYVYNNQDGSKTYLEIEATKVSRNGQAENYSSTISDGYLNIKIGDPDKEITSEQKYAIEYTVVGAISGYDQFDELYWNVTGDKWPVPIQRVSGRVTLLGGFTQSSCYQGYAGSTEICEIDEDSENGYKFNSTRELSVGEQLTVALGFEKGAVPLLVGKAPKTVFDDFTKFENISVSFLILLVGLVAIVFLWLRKGRDMWFGRNYLLSNKSKVSPVLGKETVVVEYSPPENLRPAQLALILDEKAEAVDVTATLIDLANRGYLIITEEAKKWAFGNTDYIFDRKKSDTKDLLEFEQELLLRLFDNSGSVKMSDLKNKFYKDLAVVKEKLYLDLTDKKLFIENPTKVRSRYSLLSIVIGIAGSGLIWLGFSIVFGLLVMVGIVLIFLSVVLLIFAQFMPARTAKGRQIFVRAQGYKLFIETAEKHRQQFFEKKNIFNEVLPYATAFGLTKKFAKSFEKMGIEPEKPSWYHSNSTFNALAFGTAMNSFSTTVSSSIASSPSSSGSAGGGSSGGGFGGGGGGSW